MIIRAMTTARIKATGMTITTTNTTTTKERTAISSSSPNPICRTSMRPLGDATLWICLCSPAHKSHKEGLAGCPG
jgi:hypothetical protein